MRIGRRRIGAAIPLTIPGWFSRAESPADREIVNEARPIHGSAEPAEALYEAETHYINPDRSLELDARETVSPVHHSISMAVDLTSMGQSADLAKPIFADVMVGWNTLVFRPTPAEVLPSIVMRTTSKGQLGMAEAIRTV